MAKVGFEDFFGGGDRSYKDLMFQVRGAIAATPPKPVPESASTLGLLELGTLGLG